MDRLLLQRLIVRAITLTVAHPFIAAEKGWERVAAAKLEADYVKKEMADTLFFSDPLNHRKAAP